MVFRKGAPLPGGSGNGNRGRKFDQLKRKGNYLPKGRNGGIGSDGNPQLSAQTDALNRKMNQLKGR